jgi:ADP-ribose pyrophosphatase YjhB (NUDIX family)
VGAVITDAAGRLLLIRRGTPPARGRWSLPGGRVEAGEGDAAAVEREVAEETGLRVSAGALVGSVVRGRYEIFDYACRVNGGLLRAGDDADDAAWVDGAGLARLDAGDGLAPGLLDTLEGWGALPP